MVLHTLSFDRHNSTDDLTQVFILGLNFPETRLVIVGSPSIDNSRHS